jgi:hypothetical protein
MEQSPSESNISSASQEIPKFYKPRSNYHICITNQQMRIDKIGLIIHYYSPKRFGRFATIIRESQKNTNKTHKQFHLNRVTGR